MIKKIDDNTWDRGLCRDPGHEVPSHIYLENGTYEYTCPGCKRRKVFRVNRPTL